MGVPAYGAPIWAPADEAEAIVPNDGTDLPHATRALFVGVAGNVKVDMVKTGTVTLLNIQAGSVLPVAVKRVWATGTTATNMIALY